MNQTEKPGPFKAKVKHYGWAIPADDGKPARFVPDPPSAPATVPDVPAPPVALPPAR